MDITIESIDASAMKPLGFTQLPSYPVRFSSVLVSGAARLVPFGDDVGMYLGRTLHVELAQERVTAIERVAPGHGIESMVPLNEPCSFQVVGRVASKSAVAEPPGTVCLAVDAGPARFVLSGMEFKGLAFEEGDAITFCIHELSLWDEEI